MPKEFVNAFFKKLATVRDLTDFNYYDLNLDYIVNYFKERAATQEVAEIKSSLRDHLCVFREDAETKFLSDNTYQQFCSYLKYELIYEQLFKILSIPTGYISWVNQTNSASKESEKHELLLSKMPSLLKSEYQNFKSLQLCIMYIEHFKDLDDFEIVSGKNLNDLSLKISTIDVEKFTAFTSDCKKMLAKKKNESLTFIKKNSHEPKNLEASDDSLSFLFCKNGN